MSTFTVTTWNLENLFRDGHEFGPKTHEEYEAKLQSLAQTILTLDPDVLAVQEVGGIEPVGDLLALLQERYPHVLLSGNPDTRGIRVGFLSKLAIESSEDIGLFPDGGLPVVASRDKEGNSREISEFGRGALRIRVMASADRPIDLINAHLKSKLLTFRSAAGQPRFSPRDENERAREAGLALLRRAAEAVALRVKANALLENNAENALILLGDMNDEPGAATTQILLGPGGSEIDPDDMNRNSSFNRPDKGDDTRLFNLAPIIPQERRYSRIYQGKQELIDHILASVELFPSNPRRLPAVDSGVAMAPMPSVNDNPNERRGEPGSDHAPITAVFEL